MASDELCGVATEGGLMKVWVKPYTRNGKLVNGFWREVKGQNIDIQYTGENYTEGDRKLYKLEDTKLPDFDGESETCNDVRGYRENNKDYIIGKTNGHYRLIIVSKTTHSRISIDVSSIPESYEDYQSKKPYSEQHEYERTYYTLSGVAPVSRDNEGVWNWKRSKSSHMTYKGEAFDRLMYDTKDHRIICTTTNNETQQRKFRVEGIPNEDVYWGNDNYKDQRYVVFRKDVEGGLRAWNEDWFLEKKLGSCRDDIYKQIERRKNAEKQ